MADPNSIIKGSKLYNEFFDINNQTEFKKRMDQCTQKYGNVYVLPTADWHLEELIKLDNPKVSFLAQDAFAPELNQKIYQYSVAF